MDVIQAITFPFQDRRWFPKLIVLIIAGFLPGMNLMLWGGYAISTARNLSKGEELPLPEWQNWSDIVVRGYLSIVATSIYYAPVVIVFGCFWLTSVLVSDRFAASLITVRCLGLTMLVGYIVIANLALNAGHIRYAQTDRFASYFAIGRRVGDVMRNVGTLLSLTLIQLIILVLTFFALVIGYYLIIIVSNIIISTSWLVGLIAIPVLVALLAGIVTLITLAFLTNGYLTGLIAADGKLNLAEIAATA